MSTPAGMLEQFPGEVEERAHAGAGVGELAGLALGKVDKILQVFHRQRAVDDDAAGGFGRVADQRESTATTDFRRGTYHLLWGDRVSVAKVSLIMVRRETMELF